MIDHGELTAAVIAAHSKPSTQAFLTLAYLVWFLCVIQS
eukprot:CAMPEP_0205852216 /NCGR_PEP_ID=MMETSP1083-20121108/906_1 /ASSEMBLY_ACC=CAM_ASM_000430 /TAXON_ID=97485 /ORGANISM="Prymnesium parvum, Strain Texoma1" /LENGTH=38 /DNA_ID= /DNA_START= /DNA_END= /DNA_ORIENTATION=